MLRNTPNNTTRYSFYHDSIGNVNIDDPLGFRDDDTEYNRDKYHSVFTIFTDELEFYGDAKTVINDFYNDNGINGILELIKEELQEDTSQGNNTMLWVEIYRSYSDFKTYVYSEHKASCNFTSNDLEDLLRAREGIEIEIDRTDTIDGKTITEVTKDDITLTGRDVLVISQSELDGTQIIISYPPAIITPLTTTVSAQHDDFDQVSLYNVGADWLSNNMFFIQSDAIRTVTVTIEIEASAVREISNGFHFIKIYKNFWNTGTEEYDLISQTPLSSIPYTGVKETITYEGDFDLVVDDSLALGFFSHGVSINLTKFNLTVSESTTYPEVNPLHKFIFPHNLFDKIVTIISNKENTFKSDFFGRIDDGYSIDGEGSFTGIISGLSIRNFLQDAERYKPLTISFKDLFSSLDAVWCIGMGIEKINNRDKIVVEDRKYFYQNVLVIELGEVTNLEVEVDENGFYNELEFGYNKSGGYERDMGLDEPSAKSIFISSVKKVKNKYSKTSKIRNDGYGKEFARRKPQIEFPTEDTKYDNYNWFLDVKDNGGGVYIEMLWADRFSVKPTGVFSVDTLTGAYFSPVNNLLRHSWWFSQGFEKDLDKFIKFVSSTGNSDLITQINEIEYKENTDILNFDLERPLLLPKIYKFEKAVNQSLSKLLKGYTTIGSNSVPNLNCLISFTFKGTTYYGYLTNLKTKGLGEWELKASNEIPRQSKEVVDIVFGVAEFFTGTDVIASIIDSSVNTPPIIGVLSYVSDTDTSVSLSWTAATDDVGVANYEVYFKLNTAESWTLFSTEGSGATSKTVTGLTEYTNYDFSIIALDGGAPVLSSERSNIITELTDDGTAPSIGVLTSGTPTSTTIPLTWTAATDDVGVIKYKVLHKLTSGGGWTTINTFSTLLEYTITGLANSTSYDVKLQAYDSAGNNSSDSNTEVAVTLGSGETWYRRLRSLANTTSINACLDSVGTRMFMLVSSPSLNDYVYVLANTSNALTGGDNWYKIGSYGSFKINNSGKIIQTAVCGFE